MKECSGASSQKTPLHAAVLHDAALMDRGVAVPHEGAGFLRRRTGNLRRSPGKGKGNQAFSGVGQETCGALPGRGDELRLSPVSGRKPAALSWDGKSSSGFLQNRTGYLRNSPGKGRGAQALSGDVQVNCGVLLGWAEELGLSASDWGADACVKLCGDGRDPGPAPPATCVGGPVSKVCGHGTAAGPPTRAEARGEPGPAANASGRAAVARPPRRG
jgi:hypothetical protein